MVDFLLHIGFPKTGTTTIQAGFLQKLNDIGKINYIGNSEESDSEEIKKIDHFIRPLIFGSSKAISIEVLAERWPFLFGLLRDDVPNVMSYEYFTIPGYGLFPPDRMPSIVRSAFGAPQVNFSVMLGVRNHVALLNSFYAHFFEWSHWYGDVANIDTRAPDIRKWLLDNILNADSHIRRGFDFNYVARLWEYEFGKRNVHITLFEDMSEDPDAFVSEWVRALGLPESIIYDVFSNIEAKRVRPRSPSHYNVALPRFGQLGRMAIRPPREMSRSKSMGFKALRLLMRKLGPTSIRVPIMDSHMGDRVLRRFEKQTEDLFSRYSIDRSKAAKYGYLP